MLAMLQADRRESGNPDTLEALRKEVRTNFIVLAALGPRALGPRTLLPRALLLRSLRLRIRTLRATMEKGGSNLGPRDTDPPLLRALMGGRTGGHSKD